MRIKGCSPLLYARSIKVLFAFIACLYACVSTAQNLSKDEATASYIYNFAKNIAWSDEAARDTFKIALYRADNPKLLAALNLLEAGIRIRGKAIEVVQVNTVKSLANYQLIFLANASASTLKDVYRVIESKPILLVTEGSPDKQLVMINLLVQNSTRMGFEMNKSNVLIQGLKPLPELILLGGTEIDVAELYRQGQASLVAMQKKFVEREQALDKLSKKIDQQEDKNQQLQTSISDSRKTIAKQAERINAQRHEIEQSLAARTALEQEVARRNVELSELRDDLLASQERLANVRELIGERELRAQALSTTIAEQEAQINTQKDAIVELDELVNSQQRALLYLKVIAALGLALVAMALIAYWVKRRDNERLAARGAELKMARDRLEIAKEKAEDASRAKSHFLSLMSHELRTPLQAIIGYTDVVLEELQLAGTSAHIEDLNRVIGNSERLLKLINDVLDLAKMESQQMALHLVDVQLAVLVEEAIDNVKPQYHKKGLPLDVSIQEGGVPLQADPEKLLHVIINLLSNALKFTERGNVALHVIHSANALTIDVEDTGIGIERSRQAHIFDQFKQADGTTTRVYEGSGLGLAITKEFVELMGGTITVSSEVGSGARFSIAIPLPIKSADPS